MTKRNTFFDQNNIDYSEHQFTLDFDLDKEELLNLEASNPRDIIASMDIDFKNRFAVGICIGINPEISDVIWKKTYKKHLVLNHLIYNYVIDEFHRLGIGIEVESDSQKLRLMCTFPKMRINDYVEHYIKPVIDCLENEYKVSLCVGAGQIATNEKGLKNAYKSAEYAFDLYFFLEKQIIDLRKTDFLFSVTKSDYGIVFDELLKSIIVKAPEPDVIMAVDNAIDVISQIHFGNWQAVIMRTMNFTGDIGDKLWKYKILREDFFDLQDELQEKILKSKTLSYVKQCLRDYYKKLLTEIAKASDYGGKESVARVKAYVKENFMEDFSVKDMAEIACVSPSYFSHLFINVTGQSFTEYVAEVRLEHALMLMLEADYRLYEICDKVGYRSERTFVDAFKKKYKMSPTKYIKSIKEAEKNKK